MECTPWGKHYRISEWFSIPWGAIYVQIQIDKSGKTILNLCLFTPTKVNFRGFFWSVSHYLQFFPLHKTISIEKNESGLQNLRVSLNRNLSFFLWWIRERNWHHKLYIIFLSHGICTGFNMYVFCLYFLINIIKVKGRGSNVPIHLTLVLSHWVRPQISSQWKYWNLRCGPLM